MTNKEAIEFLKNMVGEKSVSTIGKEGFYVELMGYHVEALNLAIKALQIVDIPHARDYVVIKGGKAYITQGHIDALLEYERNQTIKEVVERMTKSFDDVSLKDLFGGRDNVID